jgi:hypothetical protein
MHLRCTRNATTATTKFTACTLSVAVRRARARVLPAATAAAVNHICASFQRTRTRTHAHTPNTPSCARANHAGTESGCPNPVPSPPDTPALAERLRRSHARQGYRGNGRAGGLTSTLTQCAAFARKPTSCCYFKRTVLFYLGPWCRFRCSLTWTSRSTQCESSSSAHRGPRVGARGRRRRRAV